MPLSKGNRPDSEGYAKARLNVTNKGDVQDFLLRVNIKQNNDGTIKLSELYIVDQIFKDTNMTQENVKTKSITAIVSKLFKRSKMVKSLTRASNLSQLFFG